MAGANDRLLAQMNEVSASLTARTSGDDLAATLDTVTAALTEAVTARDLATTERAELTEELAVLELQVKMNRERQDEMVGQLEQAIALSFGPLEQLFKRTNLDVDSLIATVPQHLFEPGRPGRTTVSTRSFDDGSLGTRFDRLMLDLDRMNLMRIAVEKVPYAMPLHSSYRFTSPRPCAGAGSSASISRRTGRRSSPPPTAWWSWPGRRAATATWCASGTALVRDRHAHRAKSG